MVHESVCEIMKEQEKGDLDNSVFHDEITTGHPTVQQQIQELTNSQDFLSSQYDTLCNRLNIRDQLINQRFFQNERNIENAFIDIDSVEQYSHHDILEFKGLEEMINEGKSPIDAVISVINNDLELPNISTSDISTAHGFHRDGVEDNSIIYVKFKGMVERRRTQKTEKRKKIR